MSSTDEGTGATGAPFDQWRRLAESYARLAAVTPLAAGLGPAVGPGQDWQALLRAWTSQAAAPVAQLEAFLGELRARREQVRALQEQLAAFEQQLTALETATAPLLEWGRQAVRLQETLLGVPPAPQGNDRTG